MEKISSFLIVFAVAGAIFFAGLGLGLFIRQGEVDEAKGYIRDAARESAVLRERVEEHRATVEELERISRERQREIKKLEHEVTDLIGGNRQREEIIAGLEAEIGRLGGYSRSLGELAREGKRIVESLLEE